jgi:galactokinase
MSKKIVKKVYKQFKDRFEGRPLLVFAPGRINLIGEHTDYNDGYAFPAAINKGIAVAITKSEDAVSKVVALDKDELYEFDLNEVKPLENGGWRNYILGVVGEMKKTGLTFGNFNMVFSGNIPSGAGMSSSAALENSVVFALNELFELQLSKKQMILISQKAEHNYAGVNCGIMDQYTSMFGEKRSALLLDCRTITSEAYKVDFKNYKLVLINTNVKHDLSESAYNDRRAVCEKVSEMLKVNALRDVTETDLEQIKEQLSEADFQKALYVIQENNRVLEFIEAANNADVKTMGKLLYASHKGLNKQYKVSCEELDFLVDFAKSTKGVAGARMMGGGFGGCTINLVKEEAVDQYKKAVSKAFKKEFKNDCSIYMVKLSQGTRTVTL